MAVRLRDVAALAGVSVKTVSNVVNDYPHVSPEMRRRVQAALDETGYQPNATARSLRTGRTGIVGLAVPRLGDPYFAQVADAVVAAAAAHGWTVLVEQTGGEQEREADVLSGLRPRLIDGLLLHPVALDGRALASLQRRTPVVLLGEHLDGQHASLAVDGAAAAREMVDHLLDSGRTRVACVGTRPGASTGTAAQRLAGCRAALAAAGRPAPPSHEVAVGEYRRSAGAAAARQLLAVRPRPDAIFCFSDLLALGVLRALHEEGVRVPEEIAVAGFDDIPEARYAIPSLTTIAPDMGELARRAVGMLADLLDRGPPRARTTGAPAGAAGRVPTSVVPHHLVPRESTAP